jgi:glycosyltransferase involved in cell wall biosynthesis
MSFNRTQARPVRAFYRALERRYARHTERFVCVADAMAEQAVAAGLGPRQQFVTIYSGMEIDDYDPANHERNDARRAWGFADDAIICGTVARLFPGKGYEQLLAVMAECVQAEPRLRFVWVGGGSARETYLAALDRIGLRDHVHLTGLVAPGEVAAQLAGMDLLVHCSQWEGLPRVLVQALLMQVPVVSFDNDGAPEVNLPGRTGELVPLNDVDALRDAILRLAREPARRERYGREGRALCIERFDHRVMVERLEELYVSLHGAGGTECPA